MYVIRTRILSKRENFYIEHFVRTCMKTDIFATRVSKHFYVRLRKLDVCVYIYTKKIVERTNERLVSWSGIQTETLASSTLDESKTRGIAESDTRHIWKAKRERERAINEKRENISSVNIAITSKTSPSSCIYGFLISFSPFLSHSLGTILEFFSAQVIMWK